MRRPAPLPAQLEGVAFTAAMAAGVGVPPHRLRARDLDSPFHSVRTPRGSAADTRALCAAYALTCHDSAVVFSHSTAALLWGMPLPRAVSEDPRLHVLVPHGATGPRGRGVIGHRSEIERVIHSLDGIRVVSPADAWADLATIVGLDALIAAGDRLLGLPHPLAGAEEVDAAIFRRSGGRGVKSLRAARSEMRARVHSPRETWARLTIVRAGLPEPEMNGLIVLASGRRIHGDLVFRRWRVLVEYEGEQHLTDPVQWARDLDRYNELGQSGWLVNRVSKATTATDLVALTRRALGARGYGSREESHPA